MLKLKQEFIETMDDILEGFEDFIKDFANEETEEAKETINKVSTTMSFVSDDCNLIEDEEDLESLNRVWTMLTLFVKLSVVTLRYWDEVRELYPDELRTKIDEFVVELIDNEEDEPENKE